MTLDTERTTLEEMAELDTQVHLRHCNQGEYEDSCKYDEDDCPAQYFKTLDERVDDIMEDLVMGHNFEYAGKVIKSLLVDARVDELEGLRANTSLMCDCRVYTFDRIKAIEKEQKNG